MQAKGRKRKGTRCERWCAAEAERHGLNAGRIPGSGSFEGLPGDVKIEGQIYEVKARANGFKMLERWIAGNTGLILKPDRKDAMIVLWYEDYLNLLAELKELRNGQQHDSSDSGPAGVVVP